MTKAEYRIDLATRCFGMLILKATKGQTSESPGLIRINMAQEAFAYADAFIKEAEDKGLTFE